MKKSFTLTASLLLGIGALSAQTTQAPLEVSSGSNGSHSFVISGQTKNLDLCTFEICRRGSTGRLEILPIAAGSTSALLAQASIPNSEDFLIFYPADSPRDPDSRLILRHRYLIKVTKGADLSAIQARCGIQSLKPIRPGSNLIVCTEESSGKVLSQLNMVASDPAVEMVEPLFARNRSKKLAPTDPFYALPGRPTEGVSDYASDYQWYLNNTGANGGLSGLDIRFEDAIDAATGGRTGSGVVVGIVDDGVALGYTYDLPDIDDLPGHVDLVDNDSGLHLNVHDPVNPLARTFPEIIVDPDTNEIISPIFNHGTNVAGLIGAVANNDNGISGVAQSVGLSSIVLLSEAFDDVDEGMALGFEPDNIDIYNNSWGTFDSTYDFEGPGTAARAALENGILNGRAGLGSIYTWSAGNGGLINDNSNYDGYANHRYTIAVGSVGDNGVRSPFSEKGANLVVSAPSGGGTQGILTTSFDLDVDEDGLPFILSQYDPSFTGTSASTPLVSGVVALMLEADPTLNWREVQDILIRSARKIDPNNGGWIVNGAGLNFSHSYGAGLVNANVAVRMAGGIPNPPDPDNPGEFLPIAPNWDRLDPATEQIKQQLYFPTASDPNPQDGVVPDNDGSSLISTFDLTVDSDGNPLDNLRLEHVEFQARISTQSRSDLEIVLISPSGTQSILQESNFESDEQSINNWRFMTTRNWGEGSAGTWLVRITDRVSGNQAQLINARIILHGVVDPTAPVGGGPLVTSSPTTTGSQGTPLSYFLETSAGVVGISVGDLPPGLVYDSALQTISGTPAVPGLFFVPVSLTDNNGGVSNSVLSFIIRPTALALGDAVGLDGIPAVTDGDLPWDFEPDDSTDPITLDEDQRQSAGSNIDLLDNQSSVFGFNGLGEGVLLFDWKVSSEEGADRLWFNRGGDIPHIWDGFISGERAWGRAAVILPESSNNVRWIYSKDETASVGEDRGLVDNVEFVTLDKFRDDMARAGNIEGFDFEIDSRMSFLPIENMNASVPDDGVGGGSVLISPAIGNGQTASLSGWVEGPGTLEFLALHFAGFEDVFEFVYDGVVLDRLPNVGAPPPEVRRLLKSHAVGPGRHRIELRYRKDISGSTVGSVASFDVDGIFLDDIKFIPAGAAPISANNPNGDADNDGYNNHLESAFGGNWQVADIPPYLPQVVTSGGDTFIEYGVDTTRTDLVYVPQQSSDLITWGNASSVTLDRVEGNFKVMRIPVEGWTGNDRLFYRVSTVPN